MIHRRPKSGAVDDGHTLVGDEGGSSDARQHQKVAKDKSITSSSKTLLRHFVVAASIVFVIFDRSRPEALLVVRNTHAPVAVQLDLNLEPVKVLQNGMQTESSLSQDVNKGIEERNNQDESGSSDEDNDHGIDKCVPMHEWQLPSNTPWSCNAIHELGIADKNTELTYLSCGGDRCAFATSDSQDLKVVIKTPRYEKVKYNSDGYYTAWKDTIAMERLSHSRFILDLYGNCGTSQVTEFAPGMYLYAHIKHAKDLGHDHMSPIERLKVGYHVASAVADMQSFENDSVPSLVHNDLCVAQYLNVGGVYKLNDFHMSSHIYKGQDGVPCHEAPKGMNPNLDKSRSPETLEYIYGTSKKKIQRDKSDVWMLGNVMYYVLAKTWCFEGMSREAARKLAIEGTHSVIPSRLLNSTDPADQVMVKAIEMAWEHDPGKRVNAQVIARLLETKLLELVGDNRDDLFPVKLSLPDSFSDSSGEDWDKTYI